jgi:hypothetical protein
MSRTRRPLRFTVWQRVKRGEIEATDVAPAKQ